MFYIKSPAPFFRHPPQRAHQHCPRHCHAGSRKGERGCVYIALYHEEETPPLFPLPLLSIGRRSPHHQPPPAPDHQPQPRRWIKPQPEQSTGIALTGRETAQKRHSISRCPAAATKIFNDPLNLTGKGNCPRRIAPPSAAASHQPTASPAPFAVYLAIASNTSQILRFAHVSSCFLALSRFLFAASPSYATLPIEASIYIYTQRIYISLWGVC